MKSLAHTEELCSRSVPLEQNRSCVSALKFNISCCYLFFYFHRHPPNNSHKVGITFTIIILSEFWVGFKLGELLILRIKMFLSNELQWNPAIRSPIATSHGNVASLNCVTDLNYITIALLTEQLSCIQNPDRIKKKK